jgi:hypothetical protein
MKVQIKGVQEFRRTADKYIGEKTRQLNQETERSSRNIHNEAVKILSQGYKYPFNTGILKSNIRVRHNDLSSDVYTDVEYAPFVEFGTGNLVFTGSDFVFSTEIKDYAKQFQRGGNRNMIAKPFLFPAWEGERPKFITRVKKLL